MSAKNKIIFDYRCRSSSSSSSGRRWTSEDRRVSGQKNNTSSLKFTMLSPCNNKRSGRSGHIQSVKLLRTHTCTYKQLQQGAFAPNINLLIGYNRVFFFFPTTSLIGDSEGEKPQIGDTYNIFNQYVVGWTRYFSRWQKTKAEGDLCHYPLSFGRDGLRIGQTL